MRRMGTPTPNSLLTLSRTAHPPPEVCASESVLHLFYHILEVKQNESENNYQMCYIWTHLHRELHHIIAHTCK